MAQALLSLDAPRPLSNRARLVNWALLVGYLSVLGVVYVEAPEPLPAVPAAGLAHALIAAYVSGIVALLMIGHARSTGRRGFLMIGGTFLYLTVVLAVFPMFFPSALIEGQQIWGSVQDASGLFYAWHLALPVGLSVGAWMVYNDQRHHRRPGVSTRELVSALSLAVLFALLTISLVSLDLGPVLIEGTDSKTAYARLMDSLVLILSLLFLAVTLYCARNGSVIGRWLVGMALLTFGEAVLNLNAMARYSLGWYVSRFVWLAAVSVLLGALIWNLSKIDRANSEKAAVDTLTGAASRSTLLDAIYRELERASQRRRSIALLWIDLDGFKEINDQLGHQVGDEVLRRIVERLVEQVRVEDHVGRLGGDEFGVLLCDEGDVSQPEQVAERLLASLRDPMLVGDAQLHVTAAIGIACAPRDATDAEMLLQRADLAMYAAKREGGDCFEVYNEAIGQEAVARAKFRSDLSDSLREGDFLLFYQPIYEAETKRMAGAEVLVRWIRNGVQVPAAGFIPFAEESGQIVTIGHILLRRLASEVPVWLSIGGQDFFLSINLSARELADDGLIASLLEGPLVEHAANLVVEVTETLELQESSEAEANIDRIRRAGIRVAIDDFGAGFSNFARLERLRPALLKIDRSLVQRGTQFEGGVAFLTAATSVAASLNCDVVAEGIEQEAEERLVGLLGIRYVQGYRYGLPGPIEQFLTV